MAKLNEIKKHLKKGEVFRKEDFARWTKVVDRNLRELLAEGTLEKIARGIYHYPRETVFGKIPPDEEKLVGAFLRDNRFLITSPNIYNSLGLGTTQLYNVRFVYNHKRKGEVSFGNRKFTFMIVQNFPLKLTEEFLLVDLLNNLETLAEDHEKLLARIPKKAKSMDPKKLTQAVTLYGSRRTRKIMSPYMCA